MERILVVFQATGKGTESQALSFGLGAVEGGANIRLRHLESSTPAALEHQGYGLLKDGDLAWADVLGVAIEAPEPASELVALVEQVKDYQGTAGLSGKMVYVFGNTTRTQAINFADDALQAAGYSSCGEAVSNDPEHLKTVGKKLAGLTPAWQGV